ncbi:diguanylate cyclase domain-containing protein [Paraglaciecola sp. 2405UD69-4]|uniref:GGDEF domain-containing response regulator n=1 Tax=Paraglaciecola sp. 2405UD69-4 TaxID=3391836 RepID=UPI0039C8D9E9
MFDDNALTDTKMVVLVVEDDPLSAMISMQALSDIYEAHHVHNGLEAIVFCQESPPDLVLMDINMPNMSGLEASYNLKSDIKTKDIPVFFITGQTDPELEDECWDAGCVDFIAKPFSIQTLRHRVISFLSMKSSTDKLKKLSISDTLTSIPNRRFFDGFFFQQARLAARHNSSLGILKFDIDYFKRFNKEYGKFAADNCLKKIAQTLASFARRPTDFVARFESDKFVLVIPDSDLAGIEHIALAVMEAIRELSIPHLTSPSEKVTLCIGGTLITDGSLEVARFLQIVDEHLNQAKELGCGQYIIA